MKKIFILLILLLLVVTSCNKIDESDEIRDFETQTENKSEFLGSDGDVYRINIQTYNNEFPEHQELFTPGTLNITEQDTSIVLLEDKEMEMRIRGNSTREPAKKAWKIKFFKKQSLFGLPKAKDWVLLANYFDKTNIRNYLAYRLANKMSNLGFQPSSIFVDLYLNGEYQGLYMLTEQMEANEGRVDIEKYKNTIGINSFLIEADWRAISEYPDHAGKCYFRLEGYALKFKYPNCNKYLEALTLSDTAFIGQYEKDIQWAINYMNAATNTMKTNDYSKFSRYLDIGSFIDYYIVEEFFKNLDVGQTSQFYVIKQDDPPKLACGPVWDFDLSAGVVATDSYQLYDKTELWAKFYDSFYQLLFKNETFVQMVKERYTEIRPLLLEVFTDFDQIKSELVHAQQRNIERWPLPKPGDKTNWIENYAISDEYYALSSLTAHYNHLATYLQKRLSLMDKYYLITN